LKKAILHRKNSLFYLTENGAEVGDLVMSLIHTAELSGANPFDYLTQLQRHAARSKRIHRSGCHGTTATRFNRRTSTRDKTILRYDLPAWPKRILFRHARETVENAHKTRLARRRIG
jgi:hypothetical protein